MKVEDRVRISIGRRSGHVVLRADLAKLSSPSQLTEALNSLVQKGQLIRVSSGVYAKATRDSVGHACLVGLPGEVAREVFERLHGSVQIVGTQFEGDQTVVLVDAAPHRVSRTIRIGDVIIRVINSKPPRNRSDCSTLPADVDLLPKTGVRLYIERFAHAHNIAFRRSRLDDWAEAITRASGDDVTLDDTGKLLVTLKKRHLITGRQLARLMTNYVRESKHVRPV